MLNHPLPTMLLALAALATPSHAAPATPAGEPDTPAASTPAQPASTEPAQPAADAMPLYPEEADGESSLWLDVGGYGMWFTERAPLAPSTPLAFGLGFAHRVGPARLGWRVHVYYGLPGDDPLLFVYLDLLSVEYVFSEGRLRPWARGAAGLGLDLADSGEEISSLYGDPSLGDDGYFNEENGPSGGFGVTAGGGLDAYITDTWFARIEAAVRAYGGAGRTGVMALTHVGAGLSW